MKLLKKIGLVILVAIILFNTAVLLMGKTYFYRAIQKTYLSGQAGPGIYDLEKFPKREIHTIRKQPWVKSITYNQKSLSPDALSYLNEVQSVAFVVIKNGEIIQERYFDDHSEETVSNSFSMAKSLVAMLAQIAVQEGFISSLTDPVSKYLPEFNKPGSERVTLEHLMTMSSGLSWSESSGNPFSDNAEAYYGTDLKELVFKMRSVKDPGEEFIYKSGNTALLSFVIERAVGMTLSEYAATRLWQPLGAEHDAFWSLDHSGGSEKAYCCWYATATDFARFGQLLLQNGSFNSKQILDSNFVYAARTAANLTVPNSEFPNSRYSQRSLWLVQYKGSHYYYLRGILGQYVIILPEENAVVVRLGKKRGLVDDSGHPDDIYHYIAIAKELMH